MSKQNKLELFRDYDEFLSVNQVREFLSYVETEIEKWNYLEPSSYLYDWFTDEWNWFNDYESDQFYEAFMKPFEEQYWEEDWFDYDDVYEVLRELMYDMDKFDANMDHRDKDYNFYLLTSPEKTVEILDYLRPVNVTRYKYFTSLKLSQWRKETDPESPLQTLFDWAYGCLWICINYNTNLFDFIDMMKAKRLTVKKWSAVYLFNQYNGSGWCDADLECDWSFNLKLDEIGFGVDWAKRWPWWYTPDDVYGWYHPYFDKNKITFKSLKK